MEVELCAPMLRAVVTKKLVTFYTVKLWVRFHRESIFCGKRKAFEVYIRRGMCNEQKQMQMYYAAKELEPGDELYVDSYGENLAEPMCYGKFRRWWNLKFA